MSGDRTKEIEFYEPILRTLVEKGGRARVEEVLFEVGRKMAHRLTDRDHEPIKSGEARWKNTAKWARKHMLVRERPALLNPSSPHGWWEISDAGRRWLERPKLG